MAKRMKVSKRIAVLVEFNYEALEVWYPLLRFREEEGFETVAVGLKKGTAYASKKGYPCTADIGIDEASVEDFDAVVIPGGWAPDYLRRDKQVIDFVKGMDSAGKVVASICHGPWVLCSAKIIKDRRLTCFFAIKDDVENAGGLYEDSPVVVDRNLITSRKPADLPEFCKAILAKLKSPL